jgi:hypothetical protein
VYKTISLAALCGAALAAAARAEAPAAPDPDAAFEKLVERLGDPDFRVRDEAGRLLKAAGLKALPALRRAVNHPDAEVRSRANDLLPALETAALLAPKRITATFDQKPIKEVFDALTKQTGYVFDYNVADPTRLYGFRFDDASFWEAVDEICRAADLAPQGNYGDDHVHLYPTEAASPFVRRDGPFRFTALSFQQYRSLDFALPTKNAAAPPRRNESLILSFSVAVEPKLALLNVGEARLEAAYDEDKNSLLPPPPDANGPFGMRGGRWASGRYGQGNRMYSMQTQLNLQRPSEKSTTAKVVRGTVPLTLLVEQKPVVVTDKVLEAKGTKATVGATTFQIEDVTEEKGKQYKLKMTITEDVKGNPNDYSLNNSLYSRLELLDDKGAKYQIYGSSWNGGGPGNVQLEFTYGSAGGNAGPPAKLIFYEWKTIQYAAPFEFKDLPLP